MVTRVHTNPTIILRNGTFEVIRDRAPQCAETMHVHTQAYSTTNVMVSVRCGEREISIKSLDAHDLTRSEAPKTVDAGTAVKNDGPRGGESWTSTVDTVRIVMVIIRSALRSW